MTSLWKMLPVDCILCKDWTATDLNDYFNHHLQHVQQPRVSLSQIHKNTVDLRHIEYSKTPLDRKQKVTPIKIAVRKKGNNSIFFVAPEKEEIADNNQNMLGLNGISIQRKKKGKDVNISLVREPSPKPASETPQELLERLSGSGILIGKKSSKPPETDIEKGEPSTKVASEVVSSTSEPEPTKSNSPQATEPEMPDNMVVLGGIDILKKLLDSVPPPGAIETKPSKNEDEIFIEEVQILPAMSENAPPETRSDLPNETPSKPAENFPQAEIRLVNSLGQPPDYWNDSGPDDIQQSLMSAEDNLSSLNIINNFLENAITTNEPPEFLSLEQLGQGLQKQMANTQPGPIARIQPPAQISVIPQRQMQAPRPPNVINYPPNLPTSGVHQHPAQPGSSFYDQRMPQNYFPDCDIYNRNLPQNRPPVPQAPVPQFQTPQRPPMRGPRPQIQPRSFQSMAAPRPPSKRTISRPPNPRMTSAKIRRMTPPRAVAPVNSISPQQANNAAQAATALASRGITVTANRVPPQQPKQTSPITNHNIPRPAPCPTVDLTADEQIFICNVCRKQFSTAVSLQAHELLHRRYKCVLCNLMFPSGASLKNHKMSVHSQKSNLGIPVVDLNSPATKALLASAGITTCIPLSDLNGDVNGQYALPIINVNQARNKTTSQNLLHAPSVLVLGKLTVLNNS